MHSHLFLLSLSNYMIHDSTLDFNNLNENNCQKIYNDSDMLHLDDFHCPNPDCLNEHVSMCTSTSYMRYVYLDCNVVITLFIIVLKCPVCGTYHAVLPSFILPFSSYSYPFIMKTLFLFYFGKNKGNKTKICHHMQISRKTLEHFLSAFSFEYVRSMYHEKVFGLCNALIKIHHEPALLFPFLFSYHSDGLVFLTAHIKRSFHFAFFHPLE